MDPSSLIPTADFIPVHWGWMQFFLILTFILHLLFMNVMLGSSIIAFSESFIKGRPDSSVAKDISLKLPYIIAFTINLGVAPLLFLQVLYGNMIYVSSILMARYWLSVIGILILAYYTAYIYDFKFDVLNGRCKSFLTGLAMLCLLTIGFFFTNNMVLMITPENWTQYFQNPHGTILALSDPTLIPRYLHFVLASTAIAGLFQALLWSMKKNSPQAKDKIKLGLSWFSHSTLAQIVIGFWFLIALPRDVMLRFMGGNMWATFLLIATLILAFLNLSFGFQGKIKSTIASILGMVLVMVLVRDEVRVAYLEKYFHVSQLDVGPQYGPMILFLVSLVVGLAIVAYMINLARNKEA